MQTQTQRVGWLFRRIGLFMSLSRTVHGALDLATPALAALLWLGRMPEPHLILLGMVTAFAGYTAVYTLNDLVDLSHDRLKMSAVEAREDGYLDAVGVRHPMAQDMLSLGEGVWWASLWAVVALVGAYMLNPVCLFLFLGGAALEVFYCLLLKVSHLRALVSGIVKTLGGIAAVFAVDPDPSPWFLLLLWAWLFCVEIGGQNIPADWYDLEEDRRYGASTLPVALGPHPASLISLISLSLSLVLGAALLAAAPLPAPPVLSLAAWGAGLYLLVLPAWDLWRTQRKEAAIRLFNRASHYPLVMLIIILACLVSGNLVP